nr:MAG TPA: hypothetical protein [Caudoviricetes sp.]
MKLNIVYTVDKLGRWIYENYCFHQSKRRRRQVYMCFQYRRCII